MANSFIGKFRKLANGSWEPVNVKCKVEKQMFDNNMPEGTLIEIFASPVQETTASLAQKAKIHVMVRTLARFTGSTFSTFKKLIKKDAGLLFNGDFKSFSDTSSEEINDAIQAAIDIGNRINCPLD